MLKNILTRELNEVFENNISIKDVTEIRLRINKPIIVYIKCQPYYICKTGLCSNVKIALIATKQDIEDIIYKASDCSIYSVNEQIKNGFIILENGIRLGVCGNMVVDDGKIKTIINFTSVNIRIPHQISGASLCAFDYIVSPNGIKNTLIISEPGAGKTTFLRDFLLQLTKYDYCINTGIVDERGEIYGDGNSFDIGDFCDVISFCTKQQGFCHLIRSMNPSLIVTDEISSAVDAKCLIEAGNSGVSVIATIHANSLEQLRQKEIFSHIPKNYFQRFVLLSKSSGSIKCEGVYDEKFCRVYGERS